MLPTQEKSALSANPLAEFEEIGRRNPKLCVVARRQSELESPEDRKNVQAAFDAPHIGSSSIQKWFLARDVRLNDKSIKLHRDGECCCV